MQRHYGGTGAGKRPSVWILVLLLLALLGLSLVHDPETDAADPRVGPPWAPATAAGSDNARPPPEARGEEAQGEVKTDGGP